MTQAQAGMQECLVVFVRSVEVFYEPPRARAIEIQECCQRRTKNQPIGGAKVGQSGAAFSDGVDVVSALARALTT